MSKFRTRSYGRQLLIRVAQVSCAREIAARVRAAPSCVSKWMSGDARPSSRARALLERTYGIRAATWDQPPASIDACLARYV